MSMTKPCRICGSWFEPSPYAGSRQKVCSRESCQKERRRRSTAKARKKKPTLDVEYRLRKKLRSKPEPKPTDIEVQRKVVASRTRDAAIARVMVVIEEHGRQVELTARDADMTILAVQRAKPSRLLVSGARDAASVGSPPG